MSGQELAVQERFSFQRRDANYSSREDNSSTTTTTSSPSPPRQSFVSNADVPLRQINVNARELAQGLAKPTSRTIDLERCSLNNELPAGFGALVYKLVRFASTVFLITKHDRVFAYGPNKNNTLGLGNDVRCYKPKEIKELRCRQVVDIQLGHTHALALTKGGQVFQWGADIDGGPKYPTKPTLVGFAVDIQKIQAGHDFSVALDVEGRVHTWGQNEHGQLGLGDNEKRDKPTKVEGLEARRVKDIAAGGLHALALTDEGQVWAWGDNAHGQIGTGQVEEPSSRSTPILIERWYPNGEPNAEAVQKLCKAVAASETASLVLTTTGSVYLIGGDKTRAELVDLEEGKTATHIHLDPHSNLGVIHCTDGHQEVSDFYVLCVLHEGGGQAEAFSSSPSPTEGININAIYERHANKTSPGMLKCQATAPTIGGHFNNPLRSKFELIFDDTHSIFVDRNHLERNSDYLRSKFTRLDPQASSCVMNDEAYGYDVYFLYLSHLYGYPLEAQKPSIEQVKQLFSFACAHHEPKLQEACISVLSMDSLGVHNCCELYEYACAQQLEDFAKQVATFILYNFDKVSGTADFANLSDEYAKKLLKYVFGRAKSIPFELED